MTADHSKAARINDPRIDEMKQNTWIGYDRAIAIRAQMDSLLRHPKTHRMPGMNLIGDTNNGKSMLLKSFCRKHNPPDDPNAEKSTLPVLMIQTPPAADEARLYDVILRRLSAPSAKTEKIEFKLSRIKTIFRNLEVAMLILDDFFNAGSGSMRSRERFLNALRNLTIELEIPIIVSGTSQTLNILSIDPSLANRFKPAFLPKWKIGHEGGEDHVQFCQFIISIEPSLLLKKPCTFIEDFDALNTLIVFSEGLLGEIVDILRLLAEDAIRTGKEMIDGNMITGEKLKKLNWVKPSDRRRNEL